ncbi:pyridoxamine 5'-phosphate oxidase [Paracoccus sp. PS-1]|uniref:pyridoxamine 5'-phosphate oxidase n=1 Tax=unclassified Paracoccus (in: a-proteobacteria) TaxID=2688777 RepID=UPI0004914CCF|nr:MULTISPECIES: pyridoxamine 5'-phosphate oxidase [unclassified Paracoccus (in: a-proteobacteria)]MDQ7263990.1 pyridoxamine 5'-phosphate oxidase [Paracoccus sp. PS1]RQP07585.1 MAG: pyridoxamine 5'-phosphate oxidase [Paracoccus sp. BP8]UFM66529.1 pyridoxamine 5'-phosphate oxidase [Paracoccus sp. MA]
MSDRSGIFAGDDPFAIARSWLAEAERTEPNDASAMALATVDAAGLPDVRMVLLKEIEGAGTEGAFVFYTNFESAKGVEIEATGVAAFVMHWKSLRRQIRVRGHVSRVEPELADAYYASRPLQSRIGAWASRQSRPLASRAALMAEVARLGINLGLNPPRPPHWGGYRIRPVQIEFWADGAFRLHDRFRWTRSDYQGENSGLPPDGRQFTQSFWQVCRLSP